MLKNITNKMGEFWLPEDETNYFNGQIEKENENFTFKTIEKNFKTYNQNYILVNGIVENRELTLIIFKMITSGTFATVSDMQYPILYLFEGFFKRIDEISFDNIVIDIDNIFF